LNIFFSSFKSPINHSRFSSTRQNNRSSLDERANKSEKPTQHKNTISPPRGSRENNKNFLPLFYYYFAATSRPPVRKVNGTFNHMPQTIILISQKALYADDGSPNLYTTVFLFPLSSCCAINLIDNSSGSNGSKRLLVLLRAKIKRARERETKTGTRRGKGKIPEQPRENR
jgi:hypothetical protein